jgi:phosphomevalonate kinase
VITIQSPGKLMLAGELSVLEGNPCIVLALNKYVTATIQALPVITLHAPDVNLKHIQAHWQQSNLVTLIKLSDAQQKLFITMHRATEYALRYLEEQQISIQNFLVTINSDISSITLPNGSVVKPGLGSSAAVTVATVSAILSFHGIDFSNKDLIFKLSYLAHIASQGKIGSGFYIATATYVQNIIFQRCDKTWLTNMLTQQPLSKLVHQPWPNLSITPITLPKNLCVLVGFVGHSASTTHVLGLLEKFKTINPEKYYEIAQAINSIVTKIIDVCKTQDTEQIVALIKHHRQLLQQISQACDNAFETAELTNLIEIAESFGAGAKYSGAGGGDCGIAVCADQTDGVKIRQAWHKHGIIPLDVYQ